MATRGYAEMSIHSEEDDEEAPQAGSSGTVTRPTTDQQAALKKSRKPTGNIYRGLAVGLFRFRDLMLAVIVMGVQFGAPLGLNLWARGTFKGEEATSYWKFCKEVHNVTVNGTLSSPSLKDFVENSTLGRSVFEKFVGGLFMIIMYLSTDRTLLRADLQNFQMRLVFRKELKNGWGCCKVWSYTWMWIDAMINSWVVVLSNVAIVALFLRADHVKDIVFDAFGLFFLVQLDDYSADVQYEIDEEDFDEIVEEKNDNDNGHDDRNPAAGAVDIDHFTGNGTLNIECKRFATGDFWYSLARLINSLLVLLQLPCFLLLKFRVPEQEGHENLKEHLTVEDQLRLPEIMRIWMPCSLMLTTLWFLWCFADWVVNVCRPHQSSRVVFKEFKDANGQEPSWSVVYGFIYAVFIRREDPRVQYHEESKRGDQENPRVHFPRHDSTVTIMDMWCPDHYNDTDDSE